MIWDGRGRKSLRDVRGGIGGEGIGLEEGKGSKREGFNEASKGESEQFGGGEGGEGGGTAETKGVVTKATTSR